ncbi:4-nitrophenylphosphatase [Martiniozyma asiatica (nom. inval.)]|nr:4-nitrophenylphosphatase [Martiniozyma asiatica]
MSVEITTKEQANALLDKYSTFLFDCDGVIWSGNELLPSVKETLELLQSKNKKLIFVSNNSTKARFQYIEKLNSFGIFNVNENQIINSAYSTAIYINEVLQLPKGPNKKIWVLGQYGIESALQDFGYQTITADDLERKGVEISMENVSSLVDDEVNCVVVGLDFNANYLKFSLTLQYLHNKSIPFIATNIDSTFPFKGTKLPGAGSIVEIMKYASSREPDAICGKPNDGMMQSILTHHNLEKATTIMVGDRLNTDMAFGKANDIDTLFVLSGIDERSSVENGHKDVTWFASKLGDLYELTK